MSKDECRREVGLVEIACLQRIRRFVARGLPSKVYPQGMELALAYRDLLKSAHSLLASLASEESERSTKEYSMSVISWNVASRRARAAEEYFRAR